MTSLTPTQPEAPARAGIACDGVGHGGPEMLREFIVEHLQLVILHAEIGLRHIEVPDTVGLAYTVRRLVASTRAILTTVSDLAEQFPPPEGRVRKEWTVEETS